MSKQLLPNQPFTVTSVQGELELLALTDQGLGNTSWVVQLDGDIVIVDPERDPEPYLSAVEQLGGSLAVAADTHLHADFITGTPELAAFGAKPVAPAQGHYAWEHHPVLPGDVVDLGRWQLRTLATPGHTPEHVAYLVLDGATPKAVFTGGSLLVGAVARTDLSDPESTEELTRLLWRSINRDLLSLPDATAVLPTHGSGSFCAAVSGGARWTTIGAERRANPLLQVPDEDAFVRSVLAGLGSFPPYFLRLRELNRLGPHIYGALPVLAKLSATTVLDKSAQGGLVVDVRSVAEYARAHIPGSLANTLRPEFVSWLGWIVEDPRRPLIFVVDDRTDRRELVRQCLNIGYENLVGVITIDEWRGGGGTTVTTPLLTPEQVEGSDVIDVRQSGEFAGGHVPGAAHIELGDLVASGPSRGPIVVMCGHGERAATAASLLETRGVDDVGILAGGPGDWSAVHNTELTRDDSR